METVSSKITRIKNAVDNIRTVVEMPNDVIEDLASGINNKIGTLNNTINAKDEEISSLNTTVSNQNATIEELEEYIRELEQSGSAEKTNIYRVATIAERNAIADMVEGDMCVVISGGLTNMTVSDTPSTLTFPSTVVLPSAFTGSGYVSLRDTSGTIDVMVMLEQTSFRCDITGANFISIEYTSSDGITYTRTDTNAETIDLGGEVSCQYAEEWNDTFGYFLQIDSTTFDGIFTYKNNAWNFSNIGMNAKPYQLAPETLAYTNSGIIEGSMGGSWDAGNREAIDKAYSLLSTVVPSGLTDISFLYANTNLEYYPSAQLIDTSEVTNIRSLFSGCSNLKKIDLSSYNTSKVTNMAQMFKKCTSIEEINLEGFDISNVTNYSEMFYNCSNLKKLNISTMDFTGKSASTWMFGNTPNDCLIIVKDETAKNFVLACKNTFTNIQIKS